MLSVLMDDPSRVSYARSNPLLLRNVAPVNAPHHVCVCHTQTHPWWQPLATGLHWHVHLWKINANWGPNSAHCPPASFFCIQEQGQHRGGMMSGSIKRQQQQWQQRRPGLAWRLKGFVFYLQIWGGDEERHSITWRFYQCLVRSQFWQIQSNCKIRWFKGHTWG